MLKYFCFEENSLKSNKKLKVNNQLEASSDKDFIRIAWKLLKEFLYKYNYILNI